MRLKSAAFFATAALLGAASAQSCYYAAGKLALEQYVPCASGPETTSCCLAGDYCLSDGACFGSGTNMTYIAGCTDSSFKDSTCRGGDTCDKGEPPNCSGLRDMQLTPRARRHKLPGPLAVW
jgi:hypothetical protein